MKKVKATRNKDHPHPEVQKSYNFRDFDNNFNIVSNLCFRCKFLDDKSDFPNRFCDKTNDMIDYHFCQAKCPLGKWQLYDPKETNQPTQKEQKQCKQ